MNSNYKVLASAKRSFHWQKHDNGCGLACLASILAFSNLKILPEVAGLLTAKGNQLSLFDLKEAGRYHGLSCKCVHMDMPTLKQLTMPCILHTVNKNGKGHFVVSYGQCESGGSILIGDPAFDLAYLDEEKLRSIWPSGAAVYFEEMPKPFQIIIPKRVFKIAMQLLPKEVWLAMPVLAVLIILITGLLSVAFQHLLTKDTSSDHAATGAIGILLIAACFLRFALSFIQNRMLIETNAVLNVQIADQLSNANQDQAIPGEEKKPVQSLFSDVQRIRASIVTMTSLLSDLFMVIVIHIFMAFMMPAAAIIACGYIMACLAVSLTWLPHLSIIQTTIEQKVNLLTRHFPFDFGKKMPGGEVFPEYVEFARHSALLSNKIQLFLNLCGIVLLTSLLLLISKGSLGQDHYPLHMVYILLLAVYLTSIVQRLFISAIIISDGEDVCRRLNQRI